MVWIGWFLTAVIFMTGIPFIQDWILPRYFKSGMKYFHSVRILLFLVFWIITAIGIMKNMNEMNFIKAYTIHSTGGGL